MSLHTKEQTGEQTREQEFIEGYELEAGRTLEDGCAPGTYDDEHTHAGETGTNATTFYADDAPPEKRAKFKRFWSLNCGVDSHNGGEVERKTEDKARFAHAVANTVGLPSQETEIAQSLARRIDASDAGFSWWGGIVGLVLAIVAFLATLFGRDVYADCRKFRSLVAEEMGGLRELRLGMEKVANRAPAPNARTGTAVEWVGYG